jgi:hypothetical protein
MSHITKPLSSMVGMQCIGLIFTKSGFLVSPSIGLVTTSSYGISFSTHRAMIGFTLPEIDTP